MLFGGNMVRNDFSVIPSYMVPLLSISGHYDVIWKKFEKLLISQFLIFFSNDVIVTGNDQNWYQVWRNDQMITSYHISAKKHIVGVSLSDSYCMQRSLHFNRNWMKTLYFHEWYLWRQVPFYAVTCSFRMIWVIWVS